MGRSRSKWRESVRAFLHRVWVRPWNLKEGFKKWFQVICNKSRRQPQSIHRIFSQITMKSHLWIPLSMYRAAKLMAASSQRSSNNSITNLPLHTLITTPINLNSTKFMEEHLRRMFQTVTTTPLRKANSQSLSAEALALPLLRSEHRTKWWWTTIHQLSLLHFITTNLYMPPNLIRNTLSSRKSSMRFRKSIRTCKRNLQDRVRN